MLFIEYPKCTTCKKAKKWLDDHNVEYTDRNIVEENPSYEELKEMNLKDKLSTMSEEEQLKLLASNGMLIKRPLLVGDDFIRLGFKEAEYSEMK